MHHQANHPRGCSAQYSGSERYCCFHHLCQAVIAKRRVRHCASSSWLRGCRAPAWTHERVDSPNDTSPLAANGPPPPPPLSIGLLKRACRHRSEHVVQLEVALLPHGLARLAHAATCVHYTTTTTTHGALWGSMASNTDKSLPGGGALTKLLLSAGAGAEGFKPPAAPKLAKGSLVPWMSSFVAAPAPAVALPAPPTAVPGGRNCT